MARPSKSVAVLKKEGKSHRTKAELAAREAVEQECLTGRKLQEPAAIKKQKTAHDTFLKTRRLLDAVGKNDEIYSAALCRYCTNTQKLAESEQSIELLKQELDELRESREDFARSEEMAEYYRLLLKLEDTVTKKEQLAAGLRRELTDFEKENCMTIKSAARIIPKKPENKKNPLLEALNGDG